MKRLTPDIIRRTNDQRRRLGRPLLSRKGFELAIAQQAQEHVDHVLVTNLVNFVVPSELINECTSAWEVPAQPSGGSDQSPEAAAPSSDPDAAAPDAGVSSDGA